MALNRRKFLTALGLSPLLGLLRRREAAPEPPQAQTRAITLNDFDRLAEAMTEHDGDWVFLHPNATVEDYTAAGCTEKQAHDARDAATEHYGTGVMDTPEFLAAQRERNEQAKRLYDAVKDGQA